MTNKKTVFKVRAFRGRSLDHPRDSKWFSTVCTCHVLEYLGIGRSHIKGLLYQPVNS